MFKRRYEVKAVFKDIDFGDTGFSKKYFSKISANYFWYNWELKRQATSGAHEWHHVVIDTKTNEDITPNI